MEGVQDLMGHKLVLGSGNDGMAGAATPVFVTKTEGDASHTLVVGVSGKGKSLLPDNSELTMDLAAKAFEMLGRGEFSVSASLSADNAESLRNFGLFQSILLMAYQEGQKAAREEDATREAAWLQNCQSNRVAKEKDFKHESVQPKHQ